MFWLCEVESFVNVYYLVLDVIGWLWEDCDLIDLLWVSFLFGLIIGVLKVWVMEIIVEFEGEVCGFYCGVFGWMMLDGDMDLNVMI